jgi:hypothetical protein
VLADRLEHGEAARELVNSTTDFVLRQNSTTDFVLSL